jgi:hypothetical protein
MFGEDMQSDQLHVPANHFISLRMASGEAKNRQKSMVSFWFPLSVRFSQSVILGAIWLH